ncbi:carboxymuconolactone decarboxylase family protein [Hyphomonas sp. WL0036]|uniref:carboxymuconolactone decarboxylase family protein n=1 Tax=Hyphomonas sediminis TaxID=2866160 RepID=UPI001C7E37CC|nr:carboxymuconolactone decarboxylase family protein [Hyphomonas sediminis]MBY9067540.1 carboxymuconolactone decarboxylase family protein [Hyphomonas sediminis]
MPRLPYPEDLSLLAPGGDTVLGNLAPLNVFKMLCHAPHLVKPFVSMGTGFLIKGKLDPVTRECVVLRVGYLAQASYETTQHEAIGLAVGMTPELIESVKHGPGAPGLTPEQQIALTFTDHLVANPRPSDEVLAPAKAHFGLDGLEELVLLIGYYMMVCRFLETFGVDIEDGGPKGTAIVDRS